MGGFGPSSVTFVSTRLGWALETTATPGCDERCGRLWRTGDGGRTWSQVATPPVRAAEASVGAPGSVGVRFANADDGWVFGPELWVTRDGGAHWSRSQLPVGAGQVVAVEASAGAVHAVVFGDGFRVITSPVDHDAWQSSPTMVPTGAGPIPAVQLVLHGQAGWMLVVNRGVIGGERLINGQWRPWTPPCVGVDGPALLAASTTTDLVAICDEGVHAERPGGEHAYRSHDGGDTFQRLTVAVPIGPVAVAAPTPASWLIAGTDSNSIGVLMRTVDAGATWTTVHRDDQGQGWGELGFTSPQQGAAVRQSQPGRLLITYDAGTTWTDAHLG